MALGYAGLLPFVAGAALVWLVQGEAHVYAAMALSAYAAVIMPAHAGLVLLGLMLVASYLVDRRSYPRLGAAPWLVLRFRLSAVAAAACFIGAAGS
jgi:hypothetical protein